MQDIAGGLKLTPPTVSVGVRRLEEAGLLKRRPHLQTNAPFSYLTVKGQSLRRQSQNFRRQKFKHILSGLTQQDQDTMIGLLEKALQIAKAKKR